MNKGKCYFCGKEFAKSTIERHFLCCKQRQEYLQKIGESKNLTPKEVFILNIYPPHLKSLYWLYIMVDANATLKDLDKFLRDVWVECCGHLSEFKIGDVLYQENPDPDYLSLCYMTGKSVKTMKEKLKNILSEKLIFDYEYDFGSTTHLKIKVIKKDVLPQEKKIIILARNFPPIYSCSYCDKKASYFCYHCGNFICNECIKKHSSTHSDYVEEIANSLANSPRNGVCGYGFQDNSHKEKKYLPTL
ncbi:IS1096 element passenger TnpR family protein [Anaerocellum diazotrophicum]|uniref:B box-type domain-containing protein n=1 Tax=Caldicellulosiruptor diazotrophicus TaxID=2806205 RepID=A0ABM7NJW8_9FIRM|nr:B-box zinc finger protein [Caldicellulosiruptor diazotrophicus]BCS80397.1 hypothetical protein CaldiYA01_03570 [Caldicellulosiruptor diazotrophicus]